MEKQSSECKKANLIKSPRGMVKVFGPACSQGIEKHSMDSTLDRFRPAEKQKQSLIEIAALQGGYVFIAVLNQVIVGYLTFHPPEPFERWGRGGINSILELGAIEVARGFRSCGIARSMMEIAFYGGRMEDYIVIATEYYWHWDLEGSGLLVWEYRTKLEALMAAVGMTPRETNDPEINAHPANVLMVRVGNNVSSEDVRAFERLAWV